MNKITTGLAVASLTALALGAASPATAAPSSAPTTDASSSSVAAVALAAPHIAFIETDGSGQVTVAGVAPGARLAEIRFEGGGTTGLIPVGGGRFTARVDAAHLGESATLVAYDSPHMSPSVEFVMQPGYAEGENAAPGKPVIHAVSQYDDDHLVIEGTVAHDPQLFSKTEVWGDIAGVSWDFPAENGTFSLTVPASYAGQTVDVTSSYRGHSSQITPVEMVVTETNTASEAFPLEVASPATGEVVTEPTATFTGSAIPNSQIVVTRDDETDSETATLCETRVAVTGDWSCASPDLPAGAYRTIVTETPTWASAARQTAGTSFTVAEAPSGHDQAELPTLSSITLTDRGELVVRATSHGSSLARITVGDHTDVVGAIHGRFQFRLDPALLGEDATITGIRGGVDGRSLDVPLTLLEAPEASPLTAPRVHGVTRPDPNGVFWVAVTTDYFHDEWAVPSVLAKVGGEFAGVPQATWNGALYIQLDPRHAGKEVELVTTRGIEQSSSTLFVLEETPRNTAPETFPLEVTSPAEGATVPTDTTVVSGKGIPGSTVALSGDVARSGEIATADVLGDGTWTVEVDEPLAAGAQTMTVTETPYWSGVAPITSTRSFTVSDDDGDTAQPLTVTSHTDGDRYTTGIATFTGRGTPDARVTAANQWGTPMGSTRVTASGDWSFTRNLGPTSGGYDITFTMTPTTGTPTTATVHLDYEAPAQPLSVTSHVDGQTYREGIARFTGTGTVGAQLVSTNQWGTPMGKTTIGSDGTWAFSRNLGPTNPAYVLTFVATHGTDVQQKTLTLTHQKGDLVDVTISSPVIRDGGISEAHRTVTFRGTATPHATIVGKNQWGTPFGSTTASATGAFAFDRYVGPAGTTYRLTFEQKATDGTTKTTTGIDFTTGR
jgi:hypothetical protein